MKVHKKKSKSTKPKQRLKPDIAFFWVYAWLQSDKSKFAERNEATAARLHVRPATVTDRLKATVKAGKMFLDKKTVGRDADGYENIRTFTIVQPPDALIRAARNWWEYEEAFGIHSPIRNSVSAETRVNSGDDPIRNSVLITADSSNHQLSTVNGSESMNKTLQLDISHSSTTEAVGGRKSVSAQITTNQQVEPERNSVSAPEPEFYKHGADSPVPEFDPRKIPFCLYCDEVKVPLTKIPRTPEDPAHYALDTYCSDDCEEAHRVERKQAKDDVYAAAIAEMRTAGRNVL